MARKKLTTIHFIPVEVESKKEQKILVLYADEAATAQYLARTINDDTRFTAFCIPTPNMSTDSMTILMEDGIPRKVFSITEE